MDDFHDKYTKFEEGLHVALQRTPETPSLGGARKDGLWNHFYKEYGVNKKSNLLDAMYFDFTVQQNNYLRV